MADDDGKAKAWRGSMLLRRRSGRLAVLAAAALLCFGGALSILAGAGGDITERDLAALADTTDSLNEKVESLTDSLADVVRGLAQLSGGSDDDGLARRLRLVSTASADAVADLRDSVSSKVSDMRRSQGDSYEKVADQIKNLPRNCLTPPIPEHPIGGGPAEGFGAAYMADYGYAMGQSSMQAGPAPPDPCKDEDGDDEVAKCRRDAVKKAMQHSWKAYKEYAWGQDELRPLSKAPKNWGRGDQGLGLTILDAVSTLWLMDMREEFDEVRRWVANDMKVNMDYSISTFEATIRVVGGLLSAYELSGERHQEFLLKAREVADRLLWAYNTTSGIPDATVNLRSHSHHNPQWTGGSSVLSEFSTVQLELRTLSYHLNDSTYDEKATWIMDIIEAKAPPDFLCPTYLNTLHTRWTTDHITLGALGDSFYEYLLKQYLLTGKTEKRYRRMYKKAVKGIMTRLVKKSVPSGQTYVAEYKRGTIFNKMDHLACFAGGMLGLGVHEIPSGGSDSDDEAVMRVAEGLTETCYQMYKRQPTGVAPEIVEFRGGGDMAAGGRAAYYLLRPEAIESFMYMWRLTKKQKYREWGWEVFRSIERWCKVESGGYSGLRNVFMVPPQKDDLQQSFWLAETLKYLYILFSDDDALDFSEWVLNTEAHPLRIRKRDPYAKWSSEARKRREREADMSIEERLKRHRRAFETLNREQGGAGMGGYSGYDAFDPMQASQNERIIRAARQREAQAYAHRQQPHRHHGDPADPEAARLARLQQSAEARRGSSGHHHHHGKKKPKRRPPDEEGLP
eukprot:TRINITY_DN9324_c2_g2_i1.p1 TRINITY_DN9324_c2_g2~~TRINITY_DN9324_c2_g2_i1.p1  ORF type:complete len:806 (+),score=290.03 TRINITY_DN9324_c2_g2_i1:45-2420(+)